MPVNLMHWGPLLDYPALALEATLLLAETALQYSIRSQHLLCCISTPKGWEQNAYSRSYHIIGLQGFRIAVSGRSVPHEDLEPIRMCLDLVPPLHDSNSRPRESSC